MNVIAPRRTMTEAEFLAWSERQERRYEFDGFGPVAMAGSTLAHGLIQTSLLRVLGNALRGTIYRPLGSDTFMRADGRLRLPDVVVIGPGGDLRSRVIDNAVVMIEILSDSTAHVDRFTKSREYWATPSIRHYVMLDQTAIGAVVLSRGAEGWLRATAEAGGEIGLPAIGVTLPLDEVYEGLDFPPPEPDGP